MKKKIIFYGAIILIFIVIMVFSFISKLYTKYDLGDYGVSIKTLNSYIKEDNDENLLTLYNPSKDIAINVRDLKGDFWSSDEMDVIIDEYIRLISAMYYDSNIYDVTYEKTKLDFKEVGKVSLTTDRISSAYKTVTILTHKANGYLVIEIYGAPESISGNMEEVNGIINSIRFGKNSHDYSQDNSRGIFENSNKKDDATT